MLKCDTKASRPHGAALWTALLLLILLGHAPALAYAATGERVQRDERGKGAATGQWVDIWAAMPQLTESGNLPPVPFNGSEIVFENTTLRQTVRVNLPAGSPTTLQLRLQISNAFGTADLPVTAVTIGLPTAGANGTGTSAVDPTTLRALTFAGGRSGNYTIPGGALAVSDPVAVDLSGAGAGVDVVVAVSLYLGEGLPGAAGVTSHPGSRTTSYLARGDWTTAADLPRSDADDDEDGEDADADAASTEHWYFISALSAYLPKQREGAAALVVLGDSITDGRGSTTNGNDRWTDVLAGRLLQQQQQQQLQSRSSSSSSDGDDETPAVSVLNLAAGGNRVLYDGLGPNLLARTDRDVLARAGGTGGARWAVVFEGVNDLGTAGADAASQAVVAARLTAAYDQLAARLHAAGVAVFGATITPFGGVGQVYDDSNGTVGGGERERARQSVNAWIRDSGRFDAVVDFDAVVRNETRPEQLRADFDVGDHLHLNPAGYQAMGDAVDLELFRRFADGVDGMV